jgi:hypothetical protein
LSFSTPSQQPTVNSQQSTITDGATGIDMILKAIALSKQADYYTALSRVYLRLTKNLSISNIC